MLQTIRVLGSQLTQTMCIIKNNIAKLQHPINMTVNLHTRMPIRILYSTGMIIYPRRDRTCKRASLEMTV